MVLNKKISEILISKSSHFNEFLSPTKNIIVKLKSALYGCKESAKLWNNHISKFLIENGFNMSIYEQCLFYKKINDDQLQLIIFVDDFLITCKNKINILNFELLIKTTFKEYTIQYGNEHNYIGMKINYQNDKIHINMSGYINNY